MNRSGPLLVSYDDQHHPGTSRCLHPNPGGLFTAKWCVWPFCNSGLTTVEEQRRVEVNDVQEHQAVVQLRADGD